MHCSRIRNNLWAVLVQSETMVPVCPGYDLELFTPRAGDNDLQLLKRRNGEKNN